MKDKLIASLLSLLVCVGVPALIYTLIVFIPLWVLLSCMGVMAFVGAYLSIIELMNRLRKKGDL